MTRVKLPYINQFRDRHGKLRCYFRRPGGKSIPLSGVPGSPEFLEAYRLATAGLQPPKRARRRAAPGTFDAIAIDLSHNRLAQAQAIDTGGVSSGDRSPHA